tara:strand:- start:453 stop:1109 length:657 start_codon:yes stop_codon:yes gene_type:complete
MKPIENILIIIDVWKSPPVDDDLVDTSLSARIVNFLDKSSTTVIDDTHIDKPIDTLVLASYQVQPDEYLHNNNWHYHTSEAFHKKKLKFFKVQQHHHETHYKDLYHEETHPNILNYKNKNYNQIIAHFPQELYSLLGNEDIKEKRVFFAGCAFEDCFRNRPLGYQYFVENTKYSIFTKPELTQTNDGTIPRLMNENWVKYFDTDFFIYNRYSYSEFNE